MTLRLPNSHYASFPPTLFEDPAFEPQTGFNLDGANGEILRDMRNSLAPLNGFHCADHRFDMKTDASGKGPPRTGLLAGPGPFPVGTNALTPSLGMSSHIDPSNVWNQSTGSPMPADPFSSQADSGYLSGTEQSAIVRKRG
ncbi:hypothetical protein LTR85_012273 [Meristemomyces frigidus]|nr:hypothetical protein LTR85_012273 [Meristemomyces frigidus]